MNAEIIAIGSELLSPHRTDTNSLFLTEQLNRLGVEVVLKTIVGDHRERLTAAIAAAWQRSPIVITIGGLGPTEDDLTRECASRVLDRELHYDADLARGIEARFRGRGIAMPKINLRQAMRVEGAIPLENTAGTAPGQWIDQAGKILLLLPGPPRELKPMFMNSCLPRLSQVLPPAAIATRVLRIAGRFESEVEQLAAPIYTKYSNPVTTILAAPGEIQLHFRASAPAAAAAAALVSELSRQIEEVLGEAVFSTDGASLEEVVGRLLSAQSATLAVAESCTGGLLAERITKVPGSSAYFLGGVVCYSNESKSRWLGIPGELIQSHGAVSSPVAESLAREVRQQAGAAHGIGITGIAGPGGGTSEKPVGLVYIGIDGPGGSAVLEKRYLGERDIIRWQATQTALDLLRRSLSPGKPSAGSQH